METADKVYLVFGKLAVESDIDQPVRVKRTSMMHKVALNWRVSNSTIKL